MKRNRLVYALPLACLLATAAFAADDSMTGGTRSSAGTTTTDPGYSNSDRSDAMSSDRSTSSHSTTKDAAITAKVKSALLAERDLPSSQIKVQTNAGVVQLSGFLNSQEEIDRAVSVAKNVKDVKSVENNMQTK